MLDAGISKKLRILQAKQLKSSNKSVSFSQVVNQILQKGLK